MLTSLGALLAPTRCLACGRRAAAPWCRPCAEAATAPAPGCPRCLDPWTGHRCPAAGTPIASTTAPWAYEGPVRAVVAGAKARGAWAGWPRLGEPLAAAVAAGPAVRPRPPDAVVAVPGRADVVRRRGIDHARTLAQVVADRLAVPLVDALEAGPGAGRRVGGGRVAAPGDDGWWFRGRVGPASLDGATVALVDDVLTTGTTVRAAALALAGTGVVGVHVAVLARSGLDNAVRGRSPAG